MFVDEYKFMQECEEVKELGRKIGYGNMMTIASHLWAKNLRDTFGVDNGAFYPTLLMNMKDGELTELAKREREVYIEKFKKWGM